MNIIGCDLHSRMQVIAMLETETGEVLEKRLEHENGEAKAFYEGLKEPALVGVGSTGYARWFAEMLAGLGHELVVGEAAKIRANETRKQKHDRRDAKHILNLLVKGDFPKIWLPPAEVRDVRVWIEHRRQMVEWRTRAQNGLQAIALSYGLRRRHRLWSTAAVHLMYHSYRGWNFGTVESSVRAPVSVKPAATTDLVSLQCGMSS